MIHYSVALLLMVSPAHAWDFFSSPPPPARAKAPDSRPRSGPPPVCLSSAQQSKQNRYTCPDPSELYKSGMRWKTDSGWQSYQNSFSAEVSHFMGAQWKGVGIGQIYCIYQPKDSADFPIQLSIKPLITRPVYAYWEDAPKKDIINCLSDKNDPCDCQFSKYIEEELDPDKVLLEIEKI